MLYLKVDLLHLYFLNIHAKLMHQSTLVSLIWQKINQFSIKSNFIFLTFWTRLIWTKNHTLLLQKYKPSQSFHLTESIFLALFVLKNISWTDHSLYFCLHNVTGWICSWWEVFWSSNLTSKIFETTSSLPLLWFF